MTNQIRFDDGAAYERYMGKWSQLVGEAFLGWLAPKLGLRWLDVGCGNGAFTEMLVERCRPLSVYGIDPSEAQLTFARTRLAAQVAQFRQGDAIARIKKILADRPRDLCLFTLGINTAYRANELLSIKVGQVKNLRAGDVLDLKQRKTHKYRPVTLNGTEIAAIQNWLNVSQLQNEDYLFTGQRGCLTVETVSTLVKTWCQDVGLKGNYGSHSLRKTWGYWQRMERGTAVPLLMEAFGHATQQQTLAYLGIQSNEIAAIYELEL